MRAAWLVVIALATDVARAQDFHAADRTPSLLESGIPAGHPALVVEGNATRWHGIPELTTRALSARVGWRAARLAAGISQTGDGEIGWTAMGLGGGFATQDGGAAFRVVGRRDRLTPFAFSAAPADLGVEVGGGAWAQMAPAATIWASAPQLWCRGAAPPLARALEVGIELGTGDLALFGSLAHVRGSSSGQHHAGVSVGLGPLELWIAAKDRPLRGGLGIALRASRLLVSTAFESHPLLDETSRIGIAIGGAPEDR